MHVEDALALAHFVAYYETPSDEPREVYLVDGGQAGIVAVSAAALDPNF